MDSWSAPALADLWTTITGSLRATLTRQQFETWFRGMRLMSIEGSVATLGVPNDFSREWIETYFRDTLRGVLLEHTGEPLDLAIVVADAQELTRGTASGSGVAAQLSAAPVAAAQADGAHPSSAHLPSGFSPPAQSDAPSTGSAGAFSAAVTSERSPSGPTVAGRTVGVDGLHGSGLHGNGLHGNGDRGDLTLGGPLEPGGASEALRPPRPSRRANNRQPARRDPSAHGGRSDLGRGQLFGHARYPYFLSDVLLNDDYVFENFVAGPSNQLAHAASLAVGNAPAQAYNPLFLHGAVGLGKTHLLQAICHHVLLRRPDARILYLSCETFVNQFISAVEAGQLDDFRYRYRHVDMLLIDDIHFLARKERTQEEFFHTFNTLYNSKKQIILSCDSPPREIPTLEDRLVSRFKWGLVTEIEPPDHETRISIVRRKATFRGAVLPDGVAELIADNVATNVRELEGAVLKVIGYASLTRRPLTRELAEEALRDVIRPKERKVTLDTILRAVCEHYAVKPSDLTSKRRQKSISQPRQVCMYLARRLTEASLMEIGGQLGGRDHTTVMYANERIASELENSPRLKEDLDAIIRRIRAGE